MVTYFPVSGTSVTELVEVAKLRTFAAGVALLMAEHFAEQGFVYEGDSGQLGERVGAPGCP